MLLVGETGGEEGTRDICECAVPSVGFFCKPKTALNN